jgi:hypothetical protein
MEKLVLKKLNALSGELEASPSVLGFSKKKGLENQCFGSGIRIGSGFNQVSGSVSGSIFGIRSGSRRAKMSQKNRKN